LTKFYFSTQPPTGEVCAVSQSVRDRGNVLFSKMLINRRADSQAGVPR